MIITQIIITQVVIMKFYDRETELASLKKADFLKEKRSILSLIIGRRRVGKTALALRANEKAIYFFVIAYTFLRNFT